MVMVTDRSDGVMNVAGGWSLLMCCIVGWWWQVSECDLSHITRAYE